MRDGVAAQRRGDYRSAIQDFEKILAIRPGMAEAQVSLGSALAAAGQFDAAISEDTLALTTASDKNAVRMNLGTAYFRKGDMIAARKQFEAVHAALPHDLSASVMLGDVYIKIGRAVDAVAILAPLEHGHEGDMNLEYALAYSLIQTGDEQGGVARMEKVAKATHSASAYVIAGSVHLQRGHMRAALADLEPAARMTPSMPGLSAMIGQA